MRALYNNGVTIFKCKLICSGQKGEPGDDGTAGLPGDSAGASIDSSKGERGDFGDVGKYIFFENICNYNVKIIVIALFRGSWFDWQSRIERLSWLNWFSGSTR